MPLVQFRLGRVDALELLPRFGALPFQAVLDAQGRLVALVPDVEPAGLAQAREALTELLPAFGLATTGSGPRPEAEKPEAPRAGDTAELLARLRELNWTQARLARRLDLDPNTVSRWLATGRVPGYAREYLRLLVLVRRMGRLLDE